MFSYFLSPVSNYNANAPISDYVESLDFVGPNLPPQAGEGT